MLVSKPKWQQILAAIFMQIEANPQFPFHLHTVESQPLERMCVLPDKRERQEEGKGAALPDRTVLLNLSAIDLWIHITCMNLGGGGGGGWGWHWIKVDS